MPHLLKMMSTCLSNPNSPPSFPDPQYVHYSPELLFFNPHPHRLSPPVMQSMTTNGLAVPGSPTLPVPQPHTTRSSGLTLRPPSPPLPSSSSHSGPPSSHLSLYNSAPSSSSSVGSDTLATQRQEIREAWIDAEGEIPVSRLQC